ncbi:MAG: molybdopterin converting factor subunit 1 [Gammaproteobacteria bacterium]|nr:molybdopterin converting factor subunit 1 [Gammaproteobacteria bacterium]
MIRIKYFASLSESLGIKSEELEYDKQLNSAGDIIKQLLTRGETWVTEFSGDNKILIAVNQEMAERNTVINDGDEVAFFPPVTGG